MITDASRDFLTERHLGILSTIGRDGRVHAVPVGFTYLDGLVRVIGMRGTQKFVNAQRSGRANVSSAEGIRWLSFEGPARIVEDPDAVAHAVALYAARYRRPRENRQRVVLEMRVEKMLVSASLRGPSGEGEQPGSSGAAEPAS